MQISCFTVAVIIYFRFDNHIVSERRLWSAIRIPRIQLSVGSLPIPILRGELQRMLISEAFTLVNSSGLADFSSG